MNNLHFFPLGDRQLIFYQRFVLYFGIMLIVFMTAIGLVLKEDYIIIVTLIFAIAWIIIFYLYSKIFEVVLTDSGFQINNILKSDTIDVMEFKEIRRVKYFGFLLKIVFTDRKVLFIMKYEDLVKDLVFSDKEIVNKLNLTLAEKIQMMKYIDV